MSDNPEAEPLQLLTDLETECTQALNSLAGKVPQSITDRYYLYAGKHIQRAVDGYLVLRREGRIDASKLLVRPAIEAMFRVQALRTKPEIFYRFAYSERLEDHKWFRPAAIKVGASYDKDPDPPGWGAFEKAFQTEFPGVSLNRDTFSLRDAAVIVDLQDYYDTHYRMYCQYSHGALRAIGGSADELSDPEDTRTMVLCASAAIAALTAIGANSPNVESLNTRVDELSKKGPLPLKRGCP